MLRRVQTCFYVFLREVALTTVCHLTRNWYVHTHTRVVYWMARQLIANIAAVNQCLARWEGGILFPAKWKTNGEEEETCRGSIKQELQEIKHYNAEQENTATCIEEADPHISHLTPCVRLASIYAISSSLRGSTQPRECFLFSCTSSDRLCSLVVRVPGYRSRGPSSIPGATRFSEK
jgi:hypothetical protein